MNKRCQTELQIREQTGVLQRQIIKERKGICEGDQDVQGSSYE